MRTKLALTALATATALLLSGCYKTDMSAVVTRDGKVSGTWVFAMSNEAMKSIMEMDPNGDGKMDEKDRNYTGPLTDPKAYADAFFASGMEEEDEELPAGVTAARWDGKGYTGMKLTLTEVPFSVLNSEFGGEDSAASMKFTRTQAGQITFRQVVEPEEAFPGIKASTYKVRLTFPDKVVSTNGKLSGKTVTWSGKGSPKQRVLTATSR